MADSERDIRHSLCYEGFPGTSPEIVGLEIQFDSSRSQGADQNLDMMADLDLVLQNVTRDGSNNVYVTDAPDHLVSQWLNVERKTLFPQKFSRHHAAPNKHYSRIETPKERHALQHQLVGG